MSTLKAQQWDDIELDRLSPGLARRFVYGERLMLAQVLIEKDVLIPQHQHDNEQLVYIAEGGLRFWLGEDRETVVDVMAGGTLVIPSNVPHEALALERTVDFDTFSPPRQDWIDGSDTYFPRTK